MTTLLASGFSMDTLGRSQELKQYGDPQFGIRSLKVDCAQEGPSPERCQHEANFCDKVCAIVFFLCFLFMIKGIDNHPNSQGK